MIGTSLDEKLYLAFQILDYALLSAPGAPLKKALLDAGIGKDIMGSYDNGVYQPIFSVISKNANMEQKEAFVEVIENTLRCTDFSCSIAGFMMKKNRLSIWRRFRHLSF